MEGGKRKSETTKTFAEIAAQFVRKEGEKAYCRIEDNDDCLYIQAKYDVGNFIRHFRTRHTNLAKEHGLIPENVTPVKKPRNIPKKPVAVDKQLLIDTGIKLVSYHNLPLSCFQWEGLRQLLDPLEAAVGTKLNRANATGHIEQAASKIRAALANEMKSKLLCLMIDSASRLNHHVLGIGVQFAVGDKIVTRTLGMIEVKDRQTAGFLKAKVLELLARYGIKIDQIFAITVDNGANMLACVRQLKDEFEASLLTEEEEEDSNNIAEDMADKIANDFHDQARDNLNLVRCAVHSLQLAILDVVDKSHPNVKQVTDVAKRCKSVKYRTNFDYHNVTYPPVWCQTRWGGIFKMLNSFLEQKSFFVQLAQEFPELDSEMNYRQMKISESKINGRNPADLTSNWEFVEQYVAAFKPLFLCTKNLQAAHMPLNDFYMEWLMTIREVRKIENNPFCKPLVESLTRRLENLRGSMAFKMALYLDPRFSFIESKLFTVDEKEHIQRFIFQTWDRIKKLDMDTIVPPNSADQTDESNEKDDFITEMFGGTLVASCSSSSTFQQQVKSLEAELRQPTSYNVWEHWMKRRTSHRELSAVAAVVMSVPATQSMVERAFSALALVLSPHRSTLGEDTLENILLIKLNKEVYEQIIPGLYNWKDTQEDN